MATEKHKHLAEIIKECHDSLRVNSRLFGAERAWEEHVKNTTLLEEYAKAMNELSSIWETNTHNIELMVHSRIKWTIEYCIKYFYTENILTEKRQRELRLLESWNEYDAARLMTMEETDRLNVLDVGSCFNPFRDTQNFQVTAIDLHPANESVLRGDFLKIQVRAMSEQEIVMNAEENCVKELPSQFYDCVVFSLLLEYIPSSEQRLNCCRKAYELLKYEGILIVITPDSQHVGKNAMIMKNWRYTLATLGFCRIKFEKLPHITCMTFRKAADARVARKWAEQHREDYMNVSIDIPQDRNGSKLCE